MAFSISSQRRAVFAALHDQASLLVDAAQLLVEFVGADRASRPELLGELAEREAKSKMIASSIMETATAGGFLNGATAEQFRSSIALDKLIVALRTVADTMLAHNIGMLATGGYSIVDALRQGTAAILLVATDLEGGSADLPQLWSDIQHLHSESSATYRHLMADLLAEEVDAFETMRTAEVYRALDRASCALREVGDIAIGMALRHS